MICPNCQRDIAGYSNFCYFCGARQAQAQVAAAPAVQKRLVRSATDSRLAGVCGGLGEYFDVDPTLIRLVWALLTIFSGLVFGVVAYLLCWIVMPVGPLPLPVAAQLQTQPQPQAPPADAGIAPAH
jgi:phage shock protein C